MGKDCAKAGHAVFRIDAMFQRLMTGEAREVTRHEGAQSRRDGRAASHCGKGDQGRLAQHRLARVLPLLHRNNRQPHRRLAAVHVDVTPAHGNQSRS